MIIGKSLTALGGGGLKPEIRVTAKAGALLNLHYKDSSIILQSYQLGAEETQHTFVVNVSETAYVVEDATNGKSVEVLVDAVAVFEVNIEDAIRLYLYKDGDECTDLTGGWGSSGVWGGGGLREKLDTSLHVTANNTEYYGKGGWFGTTNKISTVGYSKFCVEYTGDKAVCYISVSDYGDEGTYTSFRNSNIIGSGLHTAEYDISDLNMTGYVTATVYKDKGSSGDLGNVYYKKIWLE